MQLFVLRREDADWGEYSGFVVVANNEVRARELARIYAASPDHEDDDPPSSAERRPDEWLNSPKISAQRIGEIAAGVHEGVIFVNYLRPNDRDND